VDSRRECINALLRVITKDQKLRTSTPVRAMLNEDTVAVAPSSTSPLSSSPSLSSSPISTSVQPQQAAPQKLTLTPMRLKPEAQISSPSGGSSEKYLPVYPTTPDRVAKFMKVRAIHDSDAFSDSFAHGECTPLLQFKRGDIFFEVRLEVVEGWCEGWFGGRRGFYPRSFAIRDDENLMAS